MATPTTAAAVLEDDYSPEPLAGGHASAAVGSPPAAGAVPEEGLIDVDAGLAAVLGPLMNLVYREVAPDLFELPEDVVEVSVNGPAEVWIEHAGTGYHRLAMPLLDRIWAEDLFAGLANLNQRSGTLPTLSVPLPGGHRLQMVIGDACVARTGMAISIRVMRRKSYSWADYGVGERPPGAARDREPDRRFATGYNLGTRDDLEAVIRHGWPILLVGETNSGKTSFLRMLMRMMPADRRVITIEDEAELWQSHANQVGLTVADPSHYPLYVKAILRMNPGAVIGGEVQPDNAYPLFRLLIGGHRNFLTTVHGGSAREGFEAWIANITLNAGLGPQAAAAVRRPLAEALARIILLGPDRRVHEVVEPTSEMAE